MNIYSYLCSPDIAAHCEKIGHVFNPLEMAVIVDMSNKTMREKHSAWREIIADYPDMPIRASKCFRARDSLHEYLLELIEYEESALSEFYDSNYGNTFVYRPSLVFSDKSSSDNMYSYTTAEEAWKAIRANIDDFQFKEAITHARICRDYVLEEYSGTYFCVPDEVWLNSTGDILMCNVEVEGYLNKPDGLNTIFIHIPMPFEKGDLVEFVGDPDDNGPCVLRDLPHWQQNYEKRLSGEMSDGSDMIAWIYFMDDEGQLNFNDGPCFLYEL